MKRTKRPFECDLEIIIIYVPDRADRILDDAGSAPLGRRKVTLREDVLELDSLSFLAVSGVEEAKKGEEVS